MLVPPAPAVALTQRRGQAEPLPMRSVDEEEYDCFIPKTATAAAAAAVRAVLLAVFFFLSPFFFF